MCILFYSLDKASFRMIAKIFHTHSSLIYKWVVEASEKLPYYKISDAITEIEFDEMWHFLFSQKNKLWLIKTIDKTTEKMIA